MTFFLHRSYGCGVRNVSRRHQMVDGMIIQKEIVCDNAPMAAARDQTPNPFQAEVDLERKEPNYYRGLL